MKRLGWWGRTPLLDLLPAALIGVVSPKDGFGVWALLALTGLTIFGLAGNLAGGVTLRYTKGLLSEFAGQGWNSLATSALLMGAGLFVLAFTQALYVAVAVLCALAGARGLWWARAARQALHDPALTPGKAATR